MTFAASVFLIAGLAYATWCLTVAFSSGFEAGMLGMALLCAALCYQALALFQARTAARVAGIVLATALAIACTASAALLSLPWLAPAGEAAIPSALRPTLILLLSSAAAFAIAAGVLIRDVRKRPLTGRARRLRR